MRIGISLGLGRFPTSGAGGQLPLSPPHSPVIWHHSTLGLLDASDAPVTANGTAIKTWNSQRSGYVATQVTAGQRPTYLANWKNNKPGVDHVAASSHRFEATAAWLANGSGWTVFIVGQRDNNPDSVDYNDAWLNINGTAGHKLQSATVGGLKYVATVSTNQTISGTFGFGITPAYLMWSDYGNANALDMRMRCNGVAKTVTGSRPDSSAISGYTLAGWNGVSFDGVIGEMLAYNSALSDAQIADVEAYITASSNWGAF